MAQRVFHLRGLRAASRQSCEPLHHFRGCLRFNGARTSFTHARPAFTSRVLPGSMRRSFTTRLRSGWRFNPAGSKTSGRRPYTSVSSLFNTNNPVTVYLLGFVSYPFLFYYFELGKWALGRSEKNRQELDEEADEVEEIEDADDDEAEADQGGWSIKEGRFRWFMNHDMTAQELLENIQNETTELHLLVADLLRADSPLRAVRLDNVLEEHPITLNDGTPLPRDRAAYIKVVDAEGKAAALMLAVDDKGLKYGDDQDRKLTDPALFQWVHRRILDTFAADEARCDHMAVGLWTSTSISVFPNTGIHETVFDPQIFQCLGWENFPLSVVNQIVPPSS